MLGMSFSSINEEKMANYRVSWRP